MKKRYWVFLSLSSILGILYFILFYTPILSFVLWLNTMSPGEKRDHGIETGLVDGNLANGFRVSYLRKEEGDRFFGLKQLRIRYSNPLSIFFRNRLNVLSLSIGELHLKIPAELKSQEIKFSLPLQPSKPQIHIDPKLPLLSKYEAQILKLEINNVLLEIPEIGLSLPIDNWLMKNISVKEGNVSIGTVQIKGGAFDLENSPKGSLRNGKPESFNGILKKEFFTSLKSNIPFWGHTQIQEGKISFYVEFFSGQVILESAPDNTVHLVLKNLNPSQHLLNSPLIHTINMDLVLGNTRRIDKKYLDLKYGKFKYQGNEYLIKPDLRVERISPLGDSADSYKIWLEASGPPEVSQKLIRLIFGFNSKESKKEKFFIIE